MEGKWEEDVQRVSCTRRSFSTLSLAPKCFSTPTRTTLDAPPLDSQFVGGAKEAVTLPLFLPAASEKGVLSPRNRS